MNWLSPAGKPKAGNIKVSPRKFWRREQRVMRHHHFSSLHSRFYLVQLLIILLIAGPVLVSASRIAAQDFSIQTVQVIDLSVTAANVQVFGAADKHHLGGNGDSNTFSTFPRAKALAIGDINNDGF